MGQHTGRVKPGMGGGGRGPKTPMDGFGKPSEPAKSSRPRSARTPGGNLGTLVAGKTQGRRGR